MSKVIAVHYEKITSYNLINNSPGNFFKCSEYKTSLGLRIGYPYYGITIKHFMNDYNAVEGILGVV